MLLDTSSTVEVPHAHTRAATAWVALATFVGYVGMTWVGLALPVAEGVVTPVWAPAGIALAGLVIGGLRLWPVVVLAAFVGNAISGSTPGLAAGIAIGNGAEALAAAWLLQRVGFSPALGRVRDIAVLIPVAIASCALSATNGVVHLWLRGFVTDADVAERWLMWWSGDALGMLMVGPLLLALHQVRASNPVRDASRIVEFVVLHAMLAAVAVFVFSDESTRFPALMVPLLVWSTMRFRTVGSATSAVLAGGIAISSTINGTFLFDGLDSTQTVQAIQVLVAMVALSTMMIGAALTESEHLRAKLEAALRDEQRVASHLRQIDETKDRLLAVVSHELRTPLTSILALSSLLRDRHGAISEDKRAEMYDLLVHESSRLDSLLTDLLDLERVRMGMDEPTYGAVDVPAVVHAVLDRHADNGRQMSVELDPIEIQADGPKLERIVENLVGNALKHTPLESSLAIAVQAQADGVLIKVDDAGKGVPTAEREAIFEPFTRGSDTSPADVPGTGIGLSLVAQFAELHGGRAWVQDSAGGGASFRVYLPSGPAPAPTDDSFADGTNVVVAPIPG